MRRFIGTVMIAAPFLAIAAAFAERHGYLELLAGLTILACLILWLRVGIHLVIEGDR